MRRTTITAVLAMTATAVVVRFAPIVIEEIKFMRLKRYIRERMPSEQDFEAARLAADARWDEVHPVFVSPDDEDLIGDVLTQP